MCSPSPASTSIAKPGEPESPARCSTQRSTTHDSRAPSLSTRSRRRTSHRMRRPAAGPRRTTVGWDAAPHMRLADSSRSLVPVVEETGAVLSLLVWLMFGVAAVVPALESLTWQTVAYAVLSLTVIRMVPVAVALAGAHLGRLAVLFVGWFGQRGLASVAFGLLALEDLAESAARPAITAITFTMCPASSPMGSARTRWPSDTARAHPATRVRRPGRVGGGSRTTPHPPHASRQPRRRIALSIIAPPVAGERARPRSRHRPSPAEASAGYCCSARLRWCWCGS